MSRYPSTALYPGTDVFPEVGEQIADFCNYEVGVDVPAYVADAGMQTYASAASMQTYSTAASMQTYASALSATYGSDVSVMAYVTAMEAELVLEVCDD